jgi:hypothetical protein
MASLAAVGIVLAASLALYVLGLLVVGAFAKREAE